MGTPPTRQTRLFVGLRRGRGGGANGCKDSDIGKPYGYLFGGESVAGRDIFI
jgi:hypothetical protein